MKKKRTQWTTELVKEKLKLYNLTLIVEYIPSQKLTVQCYCGKIYNPKLQSIIQEVSLSCGCLHKKQLKERNFKDITNQKFGKLVVLQLLYFNRLNRAVWLCQCDCGNKKEVDGFQLRRGNTKSCGCLIKDRCKKRQIDILNKKFGKLTVLKYLDNSIWECKCDCGCKTKCRSIDLRNGKTTKCGNCNLKRNNIFTSGIALKLHELLIKNGYNTCDKLHNYNSRCGINIDIVLRIKQYKIAIEYDGCKWHKTIESVKKDKIRKNILLKNGWKLLKIRSGFKLPSLKQLNNKLYKLINSSNYEIITLKDWKSIKYESDSLEQK